MYLLFMALTVRLHLEYLEKAFFVSLKNSVIKFLSRFQNSLIVRK